MIKSKIYALCAFAAVALSFTSCDNGGSRSGSVVDVDNGETLVGTSWKLVGIVDEAGVLQELEPKDCDVCYTLAFNTDSTYTSFSSANEIFGTFNADYVEHNIFITDFRVTLLPERGDGKLWWTILPIIESFSLQEDELKLYYNSNKNYLLFKPL